MVGRVLGASWAICPFRFGDASVGIVPFLPVSAGPWLNAGVALVVGFALVAGMDMACRTNRSAGGGRAAWERVKVAVVSGREDDGAGERATECGHTLAQEKDPNVVSPAPRTTDGESGSVSEIEVDRHVHDTRALDSGREGNVFKLPHDTGFKRGAAQTAVTLC